MNDLSSESDLLTWSVRWIAELKNMVHPFS